MTTFPEKVLNHNFFIKPVLFMPDFFAGFPGFINIYSGGVLLSHPVAGAVPSTLEGLTSVFGMGTGVTPLC